MLFHGTGCINSLAHVFGTKRFKTTGDESRNSLILTLSTALNLGLKLQPLSEPEAARAQVLMREKYAAVAWTKNLRTEK